MKVFNTYYHDEATLKAFIDNEKIPNRDSLLIQVFTSENEHIYITALLEVLDRLLPDAVIIGSTTDGEIMNGVVSSFKTVLSFSLFDHSTLNVDSVVHQKDGYNSGKYLAETLLDDDTKLMIAFADGLHTNGEAFLNGISSVSDTVIVAGGHAGDNFEFKKTFVFTKKGILEKGAVAVTLNSKRLHVHTGHSFHWHSIGNELTITRAEGNRVYTIDGERAIDVYAHYLGKDIAEGLPGIGIEFPLMVNRNGVSMARTTMSTEDDGSLILAGTLYTGEKVRIGFGDSTEIISSYHNIFDEISSRPSEAIYVYSCTARKHFLEEKIGTEILPLQKIAPVSGFFTYGEFFTSTGQELLNQTMTFVSLSEDEVVHKSVESLPSEELTSLKYSSQNALTHLINITSEELKRRAEKLDASNRLNRQLKERMELALLGSKIAVLDWDFKTNRLYISPSWKEMLGFSDDELPNSTVSWKNRAHRRDRLTVLELLREVEHKKSTYFENTHRLKHKDGHWIWVLGRAKIIYDENGKKVRMIGTHTDITEEKELQLKYFYQSEMIEQIHDSVTTTDLEGMIVSWNKGSEKTFGYTADEAIGKSISMLYQEKDLPTLKHYVKTLAETGVFNADLDLVTKDKGLIPISFSLTLLRNENGEPIGVVGINKDNTRRKRAEENLLQQKEMLHHQAHHDMLTGLPNRILFTQRLEESIKESKKSGIGFALFFIDLDKFKDINDSLGHEVGDRVLKIIANRLKVIIRKEDTLARLGGDEFTIIMNELHLKEDASALAEKILQILFEPVHVDGEMLYVSGSIGITLYPENAPTAEYLLKYADTAMYTAKDEGRNTYEFYSRDMTLQALEHMSMKTSLQQAIENKEFIIHYQPQVDTSDDSLMGIEALIRWNHPSKGLLMPTAFIPLAEETGLILNIDSWMMKTTMRQVSQWYKEGLNPGVLALNLSIKQLESYDFVAEIKRNLDLFDFKPEWLELEITERQMMKKPEEAIAKLREINDLGIAIAIDDFGTGYSSLSLLKRLPINRLKIDRSFIMDIPKDPDDIAIIQAIIALGRSLNLSLIAEGVETLEQKEFLMENGCTQMQGHYFSHPVSVETLEEKFL